MSKCQNDKNIKMAIIENVKNIANIDKRQNYLSDNIG